MQEFLSDYTNLFWVVIAVVVIGMAIALFKKIIGIAITLVAILLGVYIIFGVSPSESIKEVEKVTSTYADKFNKDEVLASLDGVVEKVVNGQKIIDLGNYKIYEEDNGEKVIEDVKNKIIVGLEEFKSTLTDDEVKNLESKLK